LRWHQGHAQDQEVTGPSKWQEQVVSGIEISKKEESLKFQCLIYGISSNYYYFLLIQVAIKMPVAILDGDSRFVQD
jgi:hypothetical protein